MIPRNKKRKLEYFKPKDTEQYQKISAKNFQYRHSKKFLEKERYKRILELKKLLVVKENKDPRSLKEFSEAIMYEIEIINEKGMNDNSYLKIMNLLMKLHNFGKGNPKSAIVQELYRNMIYDNRNIRDTYNTLNYIMTYTDHLF